MVTRALEVGGSWFEHGWCVCRIYRETADRAGFLIRTEQAYRDVWEAYRPHGLARLLFAQSADEFAKRVSAKLGDRAKVVVYGSSQLGSDTELWKKLNPDPTVEEVIRNYFIRQPVLWI